jgi:hypothetical protein
MAKDDKAAQEQAQKDQEQAQQDKPAEEKPYEVNYPQPDAVPEVGETGDADEGVQQGEAKK